MQTIQELSPSDSIAALVVLGTRSLVVGELPATEPAPID